MEQNFVVCFSFSSTSPTHQTFCIFIKIVLKKVGSQCLSLCYTYTHFQGFFGTNNTQHLSKIAYTSSFHSIFSSTLPFFFFLELIFSDKFPFLLFLLLKHIYQFLCFFLTCHPRLFYFTIIQTSLLTRPIHLHL